MGAPHMRKGYMSEYTGALVIAIVGVIGTLTSPIIAQRLAMQAKREEFKREREREIYKDKRSSYVTVTSSQHLARPEYALVSPGARGGAAGPDARPGRDARRGHR